MRSLYAARGAAARHHQREGRHGTIGAETEASQGAKWIGEAKKVPGPFPFWPSLIRVIHEHE